LEFDYPFPGVVGFACHAGTATKASKTGVSMPLLSVGDGHHDLSAASLVIGIREPTGIALRPLQQRRIRRSYARHSTMIF